MMIYHCHTCVKSCFPSAHPCVNFKPEHVNCRSQIHVNLDVHLNIKHANYKTRNKMFSAKLKTIIIKMCTSLHDNYDKDS